MSKVFISYSHDSAEHSERVLQFADALRSHGIDAVLDQYEVRPPQGWPQWCEEQLRPEVSSHVLMICTETYCNRVEGKVPVEEGRGVFHEGHIIHNYIYDEKLNRRFIPVLFDGSKTEYIPIRIRNHGRFRISRFDFSDEGYEALYRDLTDQHPVAVPDLGAFVPLPPRGVRTTFPIIASSRLPSAELLIGRDAELALLDSAWSGKDRKNVVTIIAWGGVGKTTLVAHWAATKMNDVERYFDWSFYRQGSGTDKGASADVFVKTALEFFGDRELAASAADGWQKGERIAQLVAQQRTLLILDGLEPLQDAKTGELRDPALRALLRGLAARNPGLCLVTTRHQIPDLDTFQKTTAPEWRLARLSIEAGASLLKTLGVDGTPAEREQLAADVKGHALTLTLMGRYLAEAHGGDIRKRDLVSLRDADDEETSGHAFRVMEAYERWLEHDGRDVELAILRLLGLFDRPATPDCLAALREAPAIHRLTDALVTLTDARWNVAVKHLVQLGLVEEQLWEPRRIVGYSEEEAKRVNEERLRLGEPRSPKTDGGKRIAGNALDTHPLIREYFARRLRETARKAWRLAHGRLYEHLAGSVPYWPEGLDGLQPLYQAVLHGCQAGRYQETLDYIYGARILRGTSGPYRFYNTKMLGAIGTNLAAVSCFFSAAWNHPAPEVTKSHQAWLLNSAAFSLRALGRLDEARESLRAGLELVIAHEEWKAAASGACNLSELELMLGDVTSAVRQTEKGVSFADRSNDTFERLVNRTTHADALHQAGQAGDARDRFREAEALQKQNYPDYPLLYSLRGFQFCDLLLHEVECSAWRGMLTSRKISSLTPALARVEQRAAWALTVATRTEWLLDIGLDNLTLGRVALYGAIIERASINDQDSHVEIAVHGLRQAGHLDYLAGALLTRAWLRAFKGDPAAARADLDEAQQIAERGPMPLFLADVHLHRARLFFRENLAEAKEELAKAKHLINKHGYHRRDEELRDAEEVIR